MFTRADSNMKTVALINQKGGSGKTTLAISLAAAFQHDGKNVLVLDLDPQASATEWHDVRKDPLPHVESIQPSRLAKTVESAKEIGTDILILDTAPHSEATALDAARVADLVLVPCKPSIMDLRAMTKTVDLLKLVKVPAYAIMNGVQHHSIQAAEQAAVTIHDHLKFPVAPLAMGERIAFSRCLIEGQAAQEYEPGGKAAVETAALLSWVKKQLKVS